MTGAPGGWPGHKANRSFAGQGGLFGSVIEYGVASGCAAETAAIIASPPPRNVLRSRPRSLLPDNLPTLHHEPDTLDSGDVVGRITVDCDEIREQPGFDCAAVP